MESRDAGSSVATDRSEDRQEEEVMEHGDWGTEIAESGGDRWDDEGFPEPREEPRGSGPAGGGGDEALGEEAELRRGLELVDELLEVQPDSLELRERRLRYARRLGDREVLVETCLDLAELLAKEEERRSARVLYRRVLELDPDNQAAESGLARLDVGELEEKRQSGKRAGAAGGAQTASTPEEQEARRELGMRLWTEFENSIREMPWLHAATQAYQSAGPDALPPLEAFEMLAHYLMARDRHRDAADVLVRALELSDAGDEEMQDILYYLGVAHRKMGDRERAEEYFERLAGVDPEFARVRAELPDESDG
jgi:tetratricopeptide (TPR) repeat protein